MQTQTSTLLAYRHTTFRTRIALEALENEASLLEIAQKYALPVWQVDSWRKKLSDGISRWNDRMKFSA